MMIQALRSWTSRVALVCLCSMGVLPAMGLVLIYSDDSAGSRYQGELIERYYVGVGVPVHRVQSSEAFSCAAFEHDWSYVAIFARYASDAPVFETIRTLATTRPETFIQGFFWQPGSFDVPSGRPVSGSKVGATWQYNATTLSYFNVTRRSADVEETLIVDGIVWPSFDAWTIQKPRPLNFPAPGDRTATGCQERGQNLHDAAIDECNQEREQRVTNCNLLYPNDPVARTACISAANQHHTNCINAALFDYEQCVQLCAMPGQR